MSARAHWAGRTVKVDLDGVYVTVSGARWDAHARVVVLDVDAEELGYALAWPPEQIRHLLGSES